MARFLLLAALLSLGAAVPPIGLPGAAGGPSAESFLLAQQTDPPRTPAPLPPMPRPPRCTHAPAPPTT